MDCHSGHTIVFYEMMNYREPGSQTRCSSLIQKATLIQARASFHRKGEAIKSGSRLIAQAAFHRQQVRGRDDTEKIGADTKNGLSSRPRSDVLWNDEL